MNADEIRLHALLLSTWMPVAALAVNAGMPTKAALAILQRRQHEWRLDCVRVRIDGHNPVHCFRKMNEARVLVLGVWMPVEPVEEIEGRENSETANIGPYTVNELDNELSRLERL